MFSSCYIENKPTVVIPDNLFSETKMIAVMTDVQLRGVELDQGKRIASTSARSSGRTRSNVSAGSSDLELVRRDQQQTGHEMDADGQRIHVQELVG